MPQLGWVNDSDGATEEKGWGCCARGRASQPKTENSRVQVFLWKVYVTMFVHTCTCATRVHKEGRKDTQCLTWPSPERQMGMRLELYILVLRFELLHNVHSVCS